MIDQSGCFRLNDWQDDKNKDQYQCKHHNHGQDSANPLAGLLLNNLSLHYLFVGFNGVFKHSQNVLICFYELYPLLLSVSLQLTCNVVNIIHNLFRDVEYLLPLFDYLLVEVYLSFYFK